MFQIACALEGQAFGKVVTVSTGFGVGIVIGAPWWSNLAWIIRQGATGVRRYGVILLGNFVTVQFVDIDVARQAMKPKSSVYGKNLRAASSLTPAKVR